MCSFRSVHWQVVRMRLFLFFSRSSINLSILLSFSTKIIRMNSIRFCFNRRVCWSVHSIICCTADNIFYSCWSSHTANNTIIIKRKQIQIDVGISTITQEKKTRNPKLTPHILYAIQCTVYSVHNHQRRRKGLLQNELQNTFEVTKSETDRIRAKKGQKIWLHFMCGRSKFDCRNTSDVKSFHSIHIYQSVLSLLQINFYLSYKAGMRH